MLTRFAIALSLGLGTVSVNTAAAHAPGTSDADLAKRLENLKTWFEPGSVVAGPTLVDCTLSSGTKAHCFSITMKSEPMGFKAGPWCPRQITDGPDKAGIWLDKGKVYAADGRFVADLKTFYNDDRWQMFDPKTGRVNVTTTKEACAAAARPDVDPQYKNHCVECQTSYMTPGATTTYVIPLAPVRAKAPTRHIGPDTGLGLSFNGPRFDASAPVDAILGAHTLAPFDKCGGHVNLHAGYHIHAVTDCVKKVAMIDGHAPMIGIAMDGYPIHTRLDADGKEPRDLDRCRGHEIAGIGYHYHAADPGKNEILGCLSGEHGCASDERGEYCNATFLGSLRRRVWRWMGFH